jgi:hypothetical protein
MTKATEKKQDESKKKAKDGEILIKELKLDVAQFTIEGTAPYVQLQFSEKARNEMAKNMTTKKGDKEKRSPRDFDEDYKNAFHVSGEGWHGIPATAFKNAMVDACRNTGQAMTQIKMVMFIHADGVDRIDGTPLIKINGKPHKVVHPVSNSGKVADLRVRAMWDTWSAVVKIEFDSSAISLTSVGNLLSRAGRLIGIGEGRPFSKKSCGMGWGTFRIL